MVIKCGLGVGCFIGEHSSEYNKENELKPIKKQHECAIFYYVVMSGAHERA